ncbi:MAG: FAD-dependent 5-carboxymethylaminomethyl-2-thiouridine(34) oxidoreductase MnmC [Hydrogenovibrio sp.]|uniref:FAD-dependent 5-carboxymethylaminomethyl-2-thiouridine(34) oxidoreductase MnmC n=1 Tax=Hydrogenovibrio sp. TaxID=2065821 RepID=UPI0028708F87|nr:FAD-dependent 5-carboxymethylaminomethyl-2-thiouridine(34) oxidoreductase MnmC [Hydrogenovibrio sp.]MDR9498299.1 FAD-dependent 5-carboxymethylaminomethyl-2-thiouridine(34) oxidoreductase MnmC [Hydrogenovibrio sp.]
MTNPDSEKRPLLPLPALAGPVPDRTGVGGPSNDYGAAADFLSEMGRVFIAPNQFAERLQRLEAGQHFWVAQVGFGAGLTFLQVCALWQTLVVPRFAQGDLPQLRYLSFEPRPLTHSQLRQAHQSLVDSLVDSPANPPASVELTDWMARLQADYPLRLPGWHQCDWADLGVSLQVFWGEALAGLRELETPMDVWLLDGLASAGHSTETGAETGSETPGSALFQPALFQTMARLSHAGSTFSVCPATGEMDPVLAQAGFAVRTRAGLGDRHPMGCGEMRHPRAETCLTPWFAPAPAVKRRQSGLSALVVGGGLAGATTARALAEAGLEVTVLEAQEAPAQAASGNLGGTLHPLVTADWNRRSQFYTLGLAATHRWLQPWLADPVTGVQGELAGSVQLAVSDALSARFDKALSAVPLPEALAQPLDAKQASAQLGTQTEVAGMWFPQGGWVSPPTVVQHCLTHPNIRVVCNASVSDWGKNDQAWWVETAQGRFVADHVVLATGALEKTGHARLRLPIRPAKGQVTHLPASAVSGELSAPVNHKGYSIQASWPQAPDVAAVCGATFEGDDPGQALTAAAHQKNLEAVTSALPHWLTASCVGNQPEPAHLSGRLAYRPTTPDHLPVVGPVPDWEAFDRTYATQAPGQRPRQYPDMPYQAGLWVNNGHGSRGLMSVFLAADLLAAQITQRPWPMPTPVVHWLHPARFAIRAWQKGQSDLKPDFKP